MIRRPDVVATVSKDRIHLCIAKCPFCGKKHWHGAGSDPEKPAYGHRVPHCLRPPDGQYKLVPPPGQTGWPK